MPPQPNRPLTRPSLLQSIAEFAGPFEERFSERHLHCIWYDPAWRPRELRASNGEAIRVLHPGEWNLEAGPDFRRALLEVGGRRMEGDVELHIRPNDWKHHGHRQDPRYRDVRLHVTYYPGCLESEQLPPDCVQLSLQDALAEREGFHFDAIDCRAYPWEVPGQEHPLRKQLAPLSECQRIALLEEAGVERIRIKTATMNRRIGETGPTQALYATLLRALGYKRNGSIMELLAKRLPLSELRERSAGDALTAYALLLGVSGLFPGREDHAPLRNLRTRWWKGEAGFQSRCLPGTLWRLDALRPANHPARRLWAAAYWWTRDPQFESIILETAENWVPRMMNSLGCPPCPLDEEDRGFSTLGAQRKAALLVNACLPYAIGLDLLPLELPLLRSLPQEAENQRVRRMANSLFGPDHHPRLYRSTLCRQGLLQFYEDYGG